MFIDYNENTQTFARELRKNMTKEERKLWYEYLRSASVRWNRQKQLLDFIADFYCYKARLIIELDGGQHYDDENIKADKKRTKALEEQGLKVLRFTNLDIKYNFKAVCETIETEVKKRLPLEGGAPKGRWV